MPEKTTSNGVKTFLKKFASLEEKLAKKIKPQKRKLTITISGETQVGKTIVGKILSSFFKLKLYNVGDRQREFAQKKKLSLEKASRFLPQKIDFLMDKECLEMAVKGGYVLVGRLSGVAAGSWASCRILIVCQLKTRARRMSLKLKIPFKKALAKIKERDKEDRRRHKELYGVDPVFKKFYNLIIDNTKPTLSQLKKLVIKKVKLCLKQQKLNQG